MRKQHKLLIIAIISICLLTIFTASAYAEKIESQGLSYEFVDEGQAEYMVVGIGECKETDIVIPSEYKGLPVTKIGEKAFYNNTEITSLELSENVTEIGDFAFHYCTSLKAVNIGDGVEIIGKNSFYFCTSLKNLILGNSVDKILDYAFYNCTALDIITIPNSTTYIGNSAFDFCFNIIQVILGKNLEVIEPTAFEACYKITEVYNLSSLEIAIKSSAFGGVAKGARIVHTSLDEESILIFEDNGYVFCYIDNTYYLVSQTGNEKSLTLPKRINGSKYAINNYAFVYRTSLENVKISDGVTKIGNASFYFCGVLKTVYIPNSVTSIGKLCFGECHSLSAVYMEDSVKESGTASFQNCYSLSYIRLSKNIKEMDQAFFLNCESLVSIQLPSELEILGLGAFYNCTSLTSIIIPNKVSSIGELCFGECLNLNRVVISSSVDTVGKDAFYNCMIAKIYCQADAKPGGWNTAWNSSNRPVTWSYKIRIGDVFTFMGYSTDGKSICVSYSINKSVLEEYNQITDKNGKYGLVFASYEKLNGENPLNSDCTPISKSVVSVEMSVTNKQSFDFILNDITEDYINHPFVVALYTCENNEIKYVQSDISDTVSGISCQEIIDFDVSSTQIGSLEL